MRKTTLGRTGLEISELAFGGGVTAVAAQDGVLRAIAQLFEASSLSQPLNHI